MNVAEFVSGQNNILREFVGQNVYAVTDTNIYSLYSRLFDGLSVTVLQAGEKNKNLGSIANIITDMIKAGCDRQTTVIAVGGGVVGDMAGFASACFMRGVKWINVPTTLLAMVDSSVGGKTGVDVGGYKNVAGAFHLPERVIICTEFLNTLPEREWLCGCGEMIKHALLDKNIWDLTVDNVKQLIDRDENLVRTLVEKNIRYKESVVRADFKESGLRKRLNVGHTIGHAIENLDNFKLSHGEYVALGIIAETTMFRERVSDDYYLRVVNMARSVCRHPFPNISAEDITSASRSDKKNSDGRIVIMLTTGGGNVEEISLTPIEFKERLEKCISHL